MIKSRIDMEPKLRSKYKKKLLKITKGKHISRAEFEKTFVSLWKTAKSRKINKKGVAKEMKNYRR